MRKLTLALDALPSLREATHSDIDVAAAATLAELAGVGAIRLGVTDDLKPVTEKDVLETRRASRVFELRMPPSQALLKVALEARPNLAVLAMPGRDGRSPSWPLDLRARGISLAPLIRMLGDAGIPIGVLVAPNIEAVKAAHGEGARNVEIFTGLVVELPPDERRVALEELGDAVRLASKLGIAVSIGGSLGYRNLQEVLEAAPAVSSVTVGRSALSRAVLVGLDRALRDLQTNIA